MVALWAIRTRGEGGGTMWTTAACTDMSGGGDVGGVGVAVLSAFALWVWGVVWSVWVGLGLSLSGSVSVCLLVVRALGRCARDSLRAKISSSC